MARRRTVVIGVLLVVIAVLVLFLGLFFGLRATSSTTRGAVVTNGYECAQIGSDVLTKGGSAVDAALAALFCEGVAMPQSMGLGGGFFMTIYTKSSGVVEALNAREVAPEMATEDMFGGNSSLSSKGALSIAVPGELKGYWYAHQRYGSLPWSDLIQPTIDLCRTGHLVTQYLANIFEARESQIRASKTLSELFINPETNSTYKVGDRIQRLQLAETLEVVAVEGADAIYNGSLTEKLVADIQDFGGIITVNDLNTYEPEWLEPITVNLPFNQTLRAFPLPGSGAILAFILNILKNFLDTSDIESVDNWQKIVESFKYGYGRRTELGDRNFVDGIDELIGNLTSEAYAYAIRENIWVNVTYSDPEHYGANTTTVEDSGTAHISVLAPNGDAVSVTSTINAYYGSDLVSPSTGIILNDEMDDFSSPDIVSIHGLPASPANYIRPGKRPLSSMCPSIVLDEDGDVKLVIGAAGGTKITTSVALVLMRRLWFNETLEKAVNARRLHHQLFPMQIQYEVNFDQDIVDGLAQIGHNYTISDTDGFAALTAIAVEGSGIEGVPDDRRSGQAVFL